MVKRKSYKGRRKKSGMPKELKNIIAGMGVGLLEPLLNQGAAKLGLGLSDEVVKIGGGFVIKKLAKGQGILNGIGDGFMIVGANRLAQGGFAGIGNLFKGNGTSSTTSESSGMTANF